MEKYIIRTMTIRVALYPNGNEHKNFCQALGKH